MPEQLNIFESPFGAVKPIPAFYNTIHLAGQELAQAKVKAGIQNDRILGLYRELGKMTPTECWQAYCRRFPEIPLTSARRAITSLTGLKMLTKTSEMKIEQYGHKNHIWALAQ